MATNNDASDHPAKQRKAQARASQHRRREMMSAHLSEDLMLEYDRRSMALRTGDQVEIMRGDFAGHEGEVLEIDYDDQEIEVDGAVNRSADGSQVARPIHPSNVRITQLDLTDPRRRAKIERKGVTVEEPVEPEPEPEETEEPSEDEEEPAVEPAPGAKGPDVEPEPEPEPEPELESEPESEAPEAEAQPEAETEETEEAEPEAGTDEDEDLDETEQAEPEADETEADEAEPAETDEDTTKEGSS